MSTYCGLDLSLLLYAVLLFMSIQMDGADHGPDYSDYEYQQALAKHKLSVDSTNNRAVVSWNFDPLEGIGGLDSNEVAELVYYELQVSLEIETESGDQSTSGSVETRGIFGANLLDGATMQNNPDEPTITRRFNGDVIEERDPDTSDPTIDLASEDGLFQMYEARSSVPYGSGGVGAGGGHINNGQVYEKHFRDTVGRGPVLDANDDLTLNNVLIFGDTEVEVSAIIRLHLVWDTAEVDDAGRAFSVPTDD